MNTEVENSSQIVDEEKLKKQQNHENIAVGDTVRIGIIMVEGTKERTQYFEGTVLSIKSRQGRKSVRIRKISQGIGIEKVFLLDSPRIVLVQRKKVTKVRRAKLYFLRKLGSSKTKKLKDQSWKLKAGQ